MDSEDSISRREFVGITAGFALSVLPVSGWALTTSSEGLATGNVKIPTTTGDMRGYWAFPKGKGPYPVILVVQEIFGVHAYIQDICRRLAKKGYVAVAPSLYFREGDVTKMTDPSEIITSVVSKVPQTQVQQDLDATLRWLEKAKVGNMAKVGITGFCWGGNATWMYCAHNPQVKAGVAWYGRLVGEATNLNPRFPVDIAKDLKVPVLGLYGGKDKGIPLESVEKMRAQLALGTSQSEIVVYPEADHAFHADYRPSYHSKSAKDGWEKTLAWFKKHGL